MPCEGLLNDLARLALPPHRLRSGVLVERKVKESPVRFLSGNAAIPIGLWWTLDLDKREVEFFAGHLPEDEQLRECQRRLLGMIEQYLQETSFREGFAEYVTKKLSLVVVQ